VSRTVTVLAVTAVIVVSLFVQSISGFGFALVGVPSWRCSPTR